MSNKNQFCLQDLGDDELYVLLRFLSVGDILRLRIVGLSPAPLVAGLRSRANILFERLRVLEDDVSGCSRLIVEKRDRLHCSFSVGSCVFALFFLMALPLFVAFYLTSGKADGEYFLLASMVFMSFPFLSLADGVSMCFESYMEVRLAKGHLLSAHRNLSRHKNLLQITNILDNDIEGFRSNSAI